MNIQLRPIARVKNSRTAPVDDNWESVESEIILEPDLPEDAFAGIEAFSHLEIIYYFDQAEKENFVYARHPRDNPDYPLTGMFAQRNKNRLNSIGLCTVELTAHEGRTLKVKFLDAIDGTPVLDIKPVFKEFEPKSEIRQPVWVSELLSKYW